MRGQMEIMGLVVIVILFIVGGMIYLFFLSGPADTSLPEVRQSVEVSNLLNAIMRMTPCEDNPEDSFDDLIHNCFIAGGNEVICESQCKDFIKEAAINASKAYNPSGQYKFTIKEPGAATPFVEAGSCNLTRRMAAESSVRVGNKIVKVGLIGCYT